MVYSTLGYILSYPFFTKMHCQKIVQQEQKRGCQCQRSCNVTS